MAEKDFFMKTVPRKWLGVSRMIEGASISDAALIPILIRRLAQTIREMNGCEYLPTITGIISTAMNCKMQRGLFETPGQPDIDASLIFLNGFEKQIGDSPLAKLTIREAKKMLSQITNEDELKSRGDIALELANKTCYSLMQQQLFARVRGDLVQKRFHSFSLERDWEKSINKAAEPAIKKLAILLLKDPSAQNLRTPKGLIQQQSTREMLDEVLV